MLPDRVAPQIVCSFLSRVPWWLFFSLSDMYLDICFNDLFSIELRLNFYTFTHLSTLHFPLWEVLKVHFCSAKTCILYLQHYFSYLCILSSSAIEASYTFCPVEAYEYSTTLTIYHRLYNLNGLTGLAGFTI